MLVWEAGIEMRLAEIFSRSAAVVAGKVLWGGGVICKSNLSDNHISLVGLAKAPCWYITPVYSVQTKILCLEQ